jgi:hypothetical protein
MQDRVMIIYTPAEFAACLAHGFALDLPADATAVDVMLFHRGGVQGFGEDALVAIYDVGHIPAEGRVLSRHLLVKPELGEREMDITLFPRHAVVSRSNGGV